MNKTLTENSNFIHNLFFYQIFIISNSLTDLSSELVIKKFAFLNIHIPQIYSFYL